MSGGGSQYSIRYEPSVEIDRLGSTPLSDLTAVNNTLARRLSSPGVYELFFHANSLLTPVRDGRDCKGEYRFIRLRRSWSAPINGEPQAWELAGYVLDTASDGPRGFGTDHNDFIWVDTPGDRLTGRATRGTRKLQEFVTGIGTFDRGDTPLPEFGGLYYFVCVDVSPRKYRVMMTLAKRLTAEEVQGAMSVPGIPFPTALIGSNPPGFAGWRFTSHDWIDYTRWLT